MTTDTSSGRVADSGTPTLRVGQLWRFPVKSMAGERLESAWLTEDGLRGDRLIHVRGPQGVLTARTRHQLLRLAARTTSDGQVLVNGRPWDAPETATLIRAAAGPLAEAVRYGGRERFDVLPLLVATDGAISTLGYDGRRLRPNIVIDGVSGLAERCWPGRALRIGKALIGVLKLRARCVCTTIDPDSGELNPEVLRRINRDFDGRFALDCWVAQAGEVRVGDPVTVVDADLPQPERGGWIVGAPYTVP
ncbi:MAG: MOSC domain-containing protein [Micromonosporaceae bacterium]